MSPCRHLRLLALFTALSFPCAAHAATADDQADLAAIDAVAKKSAATVNRAPPWARGAYVYRISTPDAAKLLPTLERGLTMASHLLDGSVRQIPIVNGLIGHDHPGAWNWDGLWPYWGRVTFRAGDWAQLSGFMARAKQKANVALSFHLNLTDVNVGLRDYPESQRFFERMVETKSLYRRDIDPATNRRDQQPPYVLKSIPGTDHPEGKDPVGIVALVDYQRFWDSGLAREMIDEFYKHLPYAPPILYLDVLNLSGGNFSTGFPDGPLGGSEQSQLKGVLAITDHLRSKGTDIATEGVREMLGPRATYVWLHGRGWSHDDYGVIDGGYSLTLPWQHVVGNMGAFNLSPIATTDGGLQVVRDHYAALAAGKPSPKRVASTATSHLAFGDSLGKEFDIPGTGDPFRGDWADMLGNFYLTGIQELYHIGKGNVRTATFNKLGALHVNGMALVGDDGAALEIPLTDALTAYPAWKHADVKKSGQIMLEWPLVAKVRVARAGTYRLRCNATKDNGRGALNVYVDQRHVQTVADATLAPTPFLSHAVALTAGEHEIAIDAGPLYAKWSDGTVACWKTPYLGHGLRISNGDVVFAEDYDRMWPDTWSGQEKIHLFSWNGTKRTWTLPAAWAQKSTVQVIPLTPDGRGTAEKVTVSKGTISPVLKAQIPYVVVPAP